ncbi:HlyD family type I secretion periplasmic adaptor subunit [Cognatishimia sp. MH4019]|uniref:HlyD family type I secretion periplasmic adaptor subunit n=1 Tax=Cognatishimia sp. MH4019 TaxID=2854030 RepID=UPI001CD73E2D|nr:HlyD family type I secretion periplasmic adaptor subunit [Cognatishimia sp. MH4019]
MSDKTEAKGRWRLFDYATERAGAGPLRWGLFVLVPLLVGVIGWSFLAPLNAAAIATGEIALSGERKTVQHLEGGLVTDILVREGQSVAANEPLLVVQDLAEQAQIEAYESQLLGARAQIVRLRAERDGETPDFTGLAEGLDVTAEAVENVVRTNEAVLENLSRSIASATELAASRKMQIAREIDGQRAQIAAKQRQIELVKIELEGAEKLQERGFASDVQVAQLAKSEAVLEGEIGALEAAVAKLQQAILDQDVEITQMRNERVSQLLAELQEAETQAENLRQELRTLTDRRARSVIRAPVSGKILGAQVHTIGAVIAPGTPLMDVVPDDDSLIVEARVNPTDIDLVGAGTEAKIQLSAFKARKVDRLEGVVLDVSADILQDEMTGERYYSARLQVAEEALAGLPQDIALSPGMPADVFLIAGERTLADYFFSPITDAAYRAFREE